MRVSRFQAAVSALAQTQLLSTAQANTRIPKGRVVFKHTTKEKEQVTAMAQGRTTLHQKKQQNC